VHIWATDLSDAALARASKGVYRGRTLTNVSTELRLRYFENRHEGWAVRQQVRDMITFERLNLLEPFPRHVFGVDIIFCQNVTIYFQLPTFRNLVERFYNVLPEGGMLFLGFSETLWNVFDKFRLLEVMGTFVYVKEPQARKASPVSAVAQAPTPPPLPPLSQQASRTASKKPAPTPRVHHSQRQGTKGAAQQHNATLPLRTSKAGTSQPQHDKAMAESDTIQRGRDLLHEGRADEALALLYQLPLNGSHAPHVLALIARAHANRGDFDLAVAEARRALELDSLTVEAYVLLGMLYAQQGQLRESMQQFERARYLDPDSALISYHLADAYRQLERGQLALREYRNALRKLTGYAPDSLLDGVAVGWLQETCERHIKLLADRQS
jgi:chemotaxis protein methyltransferase CheR